jgi:hypothetical protein
MEVLAFDHHAMLAWSTLLLARRSLDRISQRIHAIPGVEGPANAHCAMASSSSPGSFVEV